MPKIGFVTCVELGLSCMKAIVDGGADISLAVTLNDSQAVHKSGRIFLDDFCRDNNVPLIKSRHVNDQVVQDAIDAYQIDWLFIIGWSQIASNELLARPAKGVIGAHPTLLPTGRGRAAIPWAIIKGLPETGVTLFKLDQGVDTGPIIEQIRIPLDNSISATELYDIVNKAHVQLIGKALPNILADNASLIAQDESEASEWPGRRPEDGEIDLNGSVKDAERLIRAVTRPYPGAFFYRGSQKIIVWHAEFTDANDSEHILNFHDGMLRLRDYEVEVPV